MLSASRTSPGLDELGGFLGFDRTGARGLSLELKSVPVTEGCSKVEIEGALPRVRFDMLPFPSKASRRSVTPTPRDDRAKLASDMFSICIRAGEIFSSGEIPSPRCRSCPDGSTAAHHLVLYLLTEFALYSQSCRARSGVHSRANRSRRPFWSNPVARWTVTL